MTKLVKRQESIFHTFNGFKFKQRLSDGYVDATALCQANGKLFADYYRLKDTQEFIAELVLTMGIPTVKLIEKKEGRYGGTFVHPLVANHLAVWCSAKCAVFVSMLIEAWKQGRLTYTPRPKPDEELKRNQLETTVGRRELTDVAKECGKSGVHIIGLTDQIYRGLFGKTAKQIKIERSIPLSENLRKHLSSMELFYVRLIENKAKALLMSEYRKNGVVSSGDVGRIVKHLAEMFMSTVDYVEMAEMKYLK